MSDPIKVVEDEIESVRSIIGDDRMDQRIDAILRNDTSQGDCERRLALEKQRMEREFEQKLQNRLAQQRVGAHDKLRAVQNGYDVQIQNLREEALGLAANINQQSREVHRLREESLVSINLLREREEEVRKLRQDNNFLAQKVATFDQIVWLVNESGEGKSDGADNTYLYEDDANEEGGFYAGDGATLVEGDREVRATAHDGGRFVSDGAATELEAEIRSAFRAVVGPLGGHDKWDSQDYISAVKDIREVAEIRAAMLRAWREERAAERRKAEWLQKKVPEWKGMGE